ncbi:MAG: hypothetical protein RBQ77_00605 [Candidatus Methanomethylophilaceae archaeon]|jgi:hypothetical protein|nr:hypothetical protein [Candidatus Methanomethylophilaceae archaeon]NLF33356.1 hypothetical protein [Thermoplasmatales archaeon]
MISLTVGRCSVDILPVVKGLISETDKVRSALAAKEYEAYAVALGVEEIEAVRMRAELPEEYEPVDLDLVYSHRLSTFGKVTLPDPSFAYLIDECGKRGLHVLPLDMNDQRFTDLYCERVKTSDFLRERGLAKRAFKARCDMSTPESFVIDWDRVVNRVKGYALVSRERERYMSDQIKQTAGYRNSLLAVIEAERAQGVADLLREVS